MSINPNQNRGWSLTNPRHLLLRGKTDASKTDGLTSGLLVLVQSISAIILLLLGCVIWLSFTEGRPGDPDMIFTTQNFAEVLSSSFTWQVMANTIGFSLVTIFVSLAFGLPIAWLVERTDFPGRTLVFTFMTLGMLIPGFAIAMGWLFMLHPRIGLVNVWLRQTFGLIDPVFNIASIIGMGWVQGLSLAPVAFIMTAAVFRAMDPSLEEAAQMSGAGRMKIFTRITSQLAWPGILAAGLYIFTMGFAAFDVPAIIGWGNRIYTFSTYLLLQLKPDDSVPRFGMAAALSTLVIGLALALSFWYARMQKQSGRYQTISGKAYRPNRLRLGHWRWSAWVFVALYLMLSKLLPILLMIWASLLPFFQMPSMAALKNMSLDHYTKDLPWELIFDGMRTTFLLMLIVPSLTIIASFAFSWIVLRTQLRGRHWFDFIAFLPHAVPGIIFGVSTLLFALYVAGPKVPLFGSILSLAIVMLIARLSYGTRMTNSGLMQLHRELEESAITSGASSGAVILKIITPLMAPTLIYAWLWVALLTFRELTLAIVLTTRDNMTLPVVVWSLWLSGGLGTASALTLILLVMMLPVIGLYWYVSRKRGLSI